MGDFRKNILQTGKYHLTQRKCHAISFSIKLKSIVTSYILNRHILNRDYHHSYLGIILSQDLKWVNHVAQMSSNAKQTLGVIRRNFRHTFVLCKFKLYCSLVIKT